MNQLSIPTYWIIFKAKWSGNEMQDREPFEIKAQANKTSLQRYEQLIKQLADNPRFIQIDGRTFATDTIDRIEPVVPTMEQENPYAAEEQATPEERQRVRERIEEIRRRHFKAGTPTIEQSLTQVLTTKP